jgi:hypothetical protein
MAGFPLHWPTPLTLVMLPILALDQTRLRGVVKPRGQSAVACEMI